MPGLATITVVGLIALAVLVVVYMKVRRSDLVGEIVEKRRSSAKLVSRADFVEGAEKIPVALAVTNDTFYYENPDLEASFELKRIDEVEYGDSLSTGSELDDKHRVLRLRSHGAAFEFVLDKNDAAKWASTLPPHTFERTPTASAM